MKKENLNETRRKQILAGIIKESIDVFEESETIKEENSTPEMQEFKFKIKHDNGVVKIKTKASSLEAAKKIVAKAEGCPESALELVK
jgi:hypothetical protein